MPVAMSAIGFEACQIANVVTDHDLVQMAALDQGADQAQPDRIVRHVDLWIERVIAGFLPEKVAKGSTRP